MKETVRDIEKIAKAVIIRKMNDRISLLENEKASLEAKKSSHEREKASLEMESKGFQARLSRVESPGKDIHNSSLSPSKESLKAQEIRRTRSLRNPIGSPSGGQPVDIRTPLLMRENPDCVKRHNPEKYSYCGKPFANITGEEVETRQCIDVPLPICPIVTSFCTIKIQ